MVLFDLLAGGWGIIMVSGMVRKVCMCCRCDVARDYGLRVRRGEIEWTPHTPR